MIYIWLVFSILNWGVVIGIFSHHFGTFRPAYVLAILMAAAGPLAVPSLLIFMLVCQTGFHFKMKPLTKKEAWEIHQKLFPHSNYDFFIRYY